MTCYDSNGPLDGRAASSGASQVPPARAGRKAGQHQFSEDDEPSSSFAAVFVLLIFGLGLAGALAAAITCWLLGASSLWIVFGHLGGGLLGALVVIGMACLRTERPEPAR